MITNKTKAYLSFGLAAIIIFGIIANLTTVLYTLGTFIVIGIVIGLLVYGFDRLDR